ncbi:glycoside hydrolase family 61 protein [Pseudomassariella vexata]|uniref:lytic cellulose monooxygenase (C4-dehydrogenating) n=1 Tax=Pseudomassariella vexata TaxID=1141098 RepID=A0A1Y2DEU8_9PEZI|nr:glycoside hydrolase family 61 protein [Pseudomassariella vexata]ORY57788.1 glycoside hydrolase family 61 protein [Pseudomassariella vexata]
MLSTLIPATLIYLASGVAAHGGLSNYTVGDTWYRGYDPNEAAAEQEGQPWMVQRTWASIDPIFSPDDPGLACNSPAAPPPSYIPISAGENLTAVYWYWLHPMGPMSVWLASCGSESPYSCQEADVNELKWFKIWEAGLLSENVETGIWWQKQFQNWDGSPDLWPVTIPENIKPGFYMVRHEILSIHVAGKPQWYPECAHLNISGTGTAVPSEEYLARFPGEYSMNDPSINIDIYSEVNQNMTHYTIPGPPVWDGLVNSDRKGAALRVSDYVD